jgi:hypothetical protein
MLGKLPDGGAALLFDSVGEKGHRKPTSPFFALFKPFFALLPGKLMSRRALQSLINGQAFQFESTWSGVKFSTLRLRYILLQFNILRLF